MTESGPSGKNTQSAALARAIDRPRRRDIAISAGLGVAVMAVLFFSGALGFSTFFGAAAALSALAVVYYLTALTAAEPTAPSAPDDEAVETDENVAALMLLRLPVPAVLIGPGGRIERANPAARAFLGLGAEGGLLSTALRQPRVLEAVSASLRGERGRVVEYATMAPLESHVRAVVEPLRLNRSGAMPWRAMLVFEDQTSSKRAERMRADFLANASHELRTPLASLSGFIETLSGPAREDAEARDRFLAIMRDQTERMRRLIDDLLSLSRVEMNEHVPPSGRADLARIASDLVNAIGPVADARAITVALDAEDASPLVEGDRDQIYEVLENLVENALKYSSDGAHVRVSVHDGLTRDAAEQLPERIAPDSGRLMLTSPAFDPAARYGVVRVRDHGVGVDRRYLPRLAERFFRVDGQKSGPASGTGLGLAIVKHIVARHRGGFAVESAPGQGSVFSVFFPLAAPADDGESDDSGGAEARAERKAEPGPPQAAQ